MYVISEEIEIPAAVPNHMSRGWLWFRCSICDRFSLRRNRWTLADAHVCQGCAGAHNEHGQALEYEWANEQRFARWELINAMSGHCNTASPDNSDSPGVLWLLRVHNAMNEAWESGRFGPDSGEHESDVIWELADSAIPDYTHDRWQIFTDLCFHNEDVEMSGDIDNADKLTDAIMPVFSDIARRGMNSWLDEKREESPEEIEECPDCLESVDECECE